MAKDPNKMVVLAISPRYAEKLRVVLDQQQARDNDRLTDSMLADLISEIDSQQIKHETVVGYVPTILAPKSEPEPTAAQRIASAMAGSAEEATRDDA